MDNTIWAAAGAAAVVLINAIKEVLILYIRAKYGWTNGHKPEKKRGYGNDAA